MADSYKDQLNEMDEMSDRFDTDPVYRYHMTFSPNPNGDDIAPVGSNPFLYLRRWISRAYRVYDYIHNDNYLFDDHRHVVGACAMGLCAIGARNNDVSYVDRDENDLYYCELVIAGCGIDLPVVEKWLDLRHDFLTQYLKKYNPFGLIIPVRSLRNFLMFLTDDLLLGITPLKECLRVLAMKYQEDQEFPETIGQLRKEKEQKEQYG